MQHAVLLMVLVTAVAVQGAVGSFGPATQSVDARMGPHLFVDEFLIAQSSGVTRATQHPKRHLDGPVVGWEQHTTQPYVSVLRDPQSGTFRMWYNAYSGSETAIAYAESDDGQKWKTPKLGLVGSDNRLIVIGRSPEHGSYGVSVLDDRGRDPDPRRRYKLLWWSGTSEPAGVSAAWSADGLVWTQYDGNPVVPYYPGDHPKAAVGVGDIVDLFYDPIRNRYASLLKLHANQSDGWTRSGRAFRRLVGQSISNDFFKWNEPWRVITPQPEDEGKLEFYGAGGTIARGQLLITFVRMLHDDYSPEPGGELTGIGYTTLATSRDGVSWQRQEDVFFDRNPVPGTWDRAMTWVSSALPVGDELFLYYGGYKRGHKVEPERERQIGLVKMPMDRFVALQSMGRKHGTIQTILLHDLDIQRLVLNADAANGTIRVQVREAGGRVAPGLSFDDCVPITGNGLTLPVRWKTGIERLQGEVRLEFEITNSKLFGFEVR